MQKSAKLWVAFTTPSVFVRYKACFLPIFKWRFSKKVALLYKDLQANPCREMLADGLCLP
jgi:hypothetical protein